MNELIKKAINETRKTIPETDKLSDDFLYGIVLYKYLYNEGRFDKADFNNAYRVS